MVSKSKDGWITLDGSHGEGGGQILRTALSLSLLTGRPFRIKSIRANRDKPGLRPQHLTAVESAALLCGAEVSGGAVGSRELRFMPGPVQTRDLSIDIGTAGATALVLHTLYLPIALKAQEPTRLSLVGGTFNQAAPSYPYLAETWRSHLREMGIKVDLASPQAGFYPRGGGKLEAWISPTAGVNAIVSDRRPNPIRIEGEAGVARLSPEIAARMAERAQRRLAEQGLEAEIRLTDWNAASPGAAIALTVGTELTRATFVGLGERGKPADRVADEAVDEMLAYLNVPEAALDPHAADQVLLPLALAEGRSVYTVSEVTDHLRTNAQTISAFLDRPIRIEEPESGRAGRVIVG